MATSEYEKMKELFSRRLADIMAAHGDRSQKELAKLLGASESTVGKWLLKKAMPRMGVIQKIADHYGVGKSYFLEEQIVHNNVAGVQQLLDDFRKLNGTGRGKALEYVHDLTENEKYTKKESQGTSA